MNKKYVYKICGWVYDPVEHDNVAFEDLPEDWRCPVYKTFLANLSSYG